MYKACAPTLTTPLLEAQLASEEFYMETSLSLIPRVPAGQTILRKDNNKSPTEHLPCAKDIHDISDSPL